MADFEDLTSPTWSNVTEGHRNLRDAVRGTITYRHPETGRVYAPRGKLGGDGENGTAVLFVRPRGWYLDELNITVDGGEEIAEALPMSWSLSSPSSSSSSSSLGRDL